MPRTEFVTVMKQTFDPRMRKLSRAAKSRTSVSANSEFQAAIAEAQPGQNDYSATMGKFCQDACSPSGGVGFVVADDSC